MLQCTLIFESALSLYCKLKNGFLFANGSLISHFLSSLTSHLCSLFSLLFSWFMVCCAHRRSLLVADLSTLWPLPLIHSPTCRCLQFALPLAAASDSLSYSPSPVQIYDYLSLTPWVLICRLWVCTGVPIWAYFGGFVIWFWVVGL